MGRTLGVDFGTSNTAAGTIIDGAPVRIALEGSADTYPTTVFLDYSDRKMLYGHAAVAALIEGREGRFMRALKRILGTPLIREQRQLLNNRMSLMEVVAQFLQQVRRSAEKQTGQQFTKVISGRPVHFHDNDPKRDAAAQSDLVECYRMAGFEKVDFQYEPEAAAIASGANPSPGKVGLVVDIGGGTSDFTVFDKEDDKTKIVASHGERIGGTDFDRALSIAHVMPLLGMGTDLRAAFGPKTHVAPVALFHDLATWEKIAFLYTADTRRAVADMAKYAVERPKFDRLAEVLDMELGHDLAFAVETAKINANEGSGVIDLGVLEKNLAVALSQSTLQENLARFASAIGQGAARTVALAGHHPNDVSQVVFVGGSSLLQIIKDELRSIYPDAEMIQGSAFSGVVDGLALTAATHDA